METDRDYIAEAEHAEMRAAIQRRNADASGISPARRDSYLQSAGRLEREAWALRQRAAKPKPTSAGVAYQPNDAEAKIIEMIRKMDRRLVSDDVVAEMEERNVRSGVKASLAVLVRAQILDNTTDSRGKGYGLREWSDSSDQSSN